MNLAEGDRIRTGPDGVALVTFLDGTTLTVLPGAEVTVRQAPAGQERTGIRLLIHAGRVWARIARAAGRRGTVSLESNEYAASAHDGLIGAEQSSDGSFVCWTRRGEVRLRDRSGQADAVLLAGQRARARSGHPIAPEPFVPSASMLEIRASGAAVPLLRTPDSGLVVGFLGPDEEVNQVFGSSTDSRRGRDRWVIDAPGGQEGPYTLVVTGVTAGSFSVTITARFAGFTVYRQQLTGVIAPGERLAARFTQSVSGGDPATARVVESSFEAFRPWDDPITVVRPEAARRSGHN
jgi:hypothetical protein